jgi:hypothetical protein
MHEPIVWVRCSYVIMRRIGSASSARWSVVILSDYDERIAAGSAGGNDS